MRTIVIAALLCAACSNTPPDTYTVYIDPAFDASTAEWIQSSCNQWETTASNAGLHLKLNTTVGFNVCTDGSCSDNTITIHPSLLASLSGDDLVGGITQLNSNHWANSYIATDDRPDQLFKTILHELGHAMGLMHDGAGNIMCGETGCEYWEPTCDDVKQWANIRGEKAACQ